MATQTKQQQREKTKHCLYKIKTGLLREEKECIEGEIAPQGQVPMKKSPAPRATPHY